jgi:hypothetical protein
MEVGIVKHFFHPIFWVVFRDATRPVDSGPHQFLHPMGTGVGPFLHPWVFPNPT